MFGNLAFFVLLVLTPLPLEVAGCFSNKIPCKGETPRVDPNTYHHMFKHNMKTVLKENAANFTKFVDKSYFKIFCKERGLNTVDSIIEYDQEDYKKIDFASLPSSFVLKSNKGSGRNIIVKNGEVLGDEGNAAGHPTREGGPLAEMIPKIMEQISTWGRPYTDANGVVTEPWYEYMKPKIIVEKFMERIPDDIKLYVVNGKVDMLYVAKIQGCVKCRNFYDADLNLMPFYRRVNGGRLGFHTFTMPSDIDPVRRSKKKLAEMIDIAERLAAEVGVNIVRIDLYHMNDKFYASEITLAPQNGGQFVEYYEKKKRQHGGQHQKKTITPPSNNV